MEAIKKSEVTAQVVNVTPFMAQNWLTQNPSNRGVSHSRVEEYASDMKSGDWMLNGEPIVIDAYGQLKNGQHRLHAVVKSGVTVPMLVVFGVDPNVCVYDRGRSRSTLDILRIKGYSTESANTSSVSCAKLDRRIRGINTYTSDIECARWIDAHMQSMQVVCRVCATAKRTNGRVNTKFSPLMLAVMYAYEAGVPENILDEFATAVRTGIITSDEQTSAVVLRNDMIGQVVPMQGSLRSKWVVMCERAIYDWVNHIPRRKTYSSTKDHMYMGVALCNS
jgi:hypothetical protein